MQGRFSPRWWPVAWLLCGVLGLGLVVFLLLGQKADGRKIDAQGAAVEGLAAAVASARAQIISLGATPNVPPPAAVVSGVAGPQGVRGPGPSDAQVQLAVDGYLAANPPTGRVSAAQVEADVASYLSAHPPAPGRDATAAQIDASVAAYMAAHPAPSGPPGSPGENGQDGKQGNPGVDGAPGSPPAGWAFEVNGVTYECVPDNGTPAPHYTCPPTSTASASASASPSQTLTSSAIPSAGTSPLAPSVPAASSATASAPMVKNGTPKPTPKRWVDLLFGVPFYRRGM